MDESCYHLAMASQAFAVSPAIIMEHAQLSPLESKSKLECKPAEHVVSLEQLNQDSSYGKVLLKCGFMKLERTIAEQSCTLSAEKGSTGYGNDIKECGATDKDHGIWSFNQQTAWSLCCFSSCWKKESAGPQCYGKPTSSTVVPRTLRTGVRVRKLLIGTLKHYDWDAEV